MTGSVTSIGIAYNRSIGLPRLSEEVYKVLSSLFARGGNRTWPMRFVGGDNGVWIELVLKENANDKSHLTLLGQFFSSAYGELDMSVYLKGVGRLDAVLRPELGYTGMLIDFPDAQLWYDEGMRASTTVSVSLQALLNQWYDISPFSAAFIDHEAEFDTDPLEIAPSQNPYAIFASSTQEDGGGVRFAPAPYRLTPLGE